MNRTVNRVVGASTIKHRTLRCCFGGCTSDSKYASITFHSFPKPCFRVRNNLVNSNRRHIENCADCKKCQKWITLCSLSSISDADKNSYVCTLHFVDRQPSESFPDPLPIEEVLKLRVCSLHFRKDDFIEGGNVRKLNKYAIPSVLNQEPSSSDKQDLLTASHKRSKRNNAKKRKDEPALVEKTVLGKQESVESCDFTNKAETNQAEKKFPTNQAEKKLPTNQAEKKLPTTEKKLSTAEKKLRSAAKVNSNSSDFDPLDLNNLLLSTTSIFQGMCKELELSTILNKHVDYLNMDKERITLTTSGAHSKQSLQIVILNKNREDATPSFSESTDDLERMLTDVESTVMSAETEYQETLETRTMSTQTDNRPLEMENKRLKLENAALKKRILCLEHQIQQQDVPKLLVVCEDE